MDKILFRSNSTSRMYMLFMILILVMSLLFIGWAYYPSIKNSDSTMKITMAVIFIFIIGAFILQFASDSFKYVITSSELVVKRPLGNIIIWLQDIKLIQIMTPTEKKKYGVFFAAKYPGIGDHKRISKDKRPLLLGSMYHRNWVLVVTGNRKYIITPDDLQLIDILTQQMEKLT